MENVEEGSLIFYLTCVNVKLKAGDIVPIVNRNDTGRGGLT